MNNFLSKNLLIIVLLLGAFLRLYGLAIDPPHLTNDEAALGYNAYSILTTLKDEHGQFLPIVFQSFGDWKPGLYIYLTTLPVAIFGLNEFSTRLVGALSGILAIYLVYLLGNKIFPKKIGIWTALFLAISPWHIHFSRGAWEVNLALTITLAAVYFFIKAIQDDSKYFVWSSILFGLTLWSYQGAKLSTLLVICALTLIYFKDIIKIPRKVLLISLLAGVVLAIPIALSFYEGKTGRLEVYSIFSYERPQAVISEITDQNNETQTSLEYYLYHSESLNFMRGILSRYLNHFSGRFLLFEGDWQSKLHGAPNTGVLLIADITLVILGFIYLSKNFSNKGVRFIVLWLLLSPLPAALSRDQVQAVRSFAMVIPLSFLLAFGISYFWDNFSKDKLWSKISVVFVVLYLFNFTYFVDQYWVHLPKTDAQDWQYGYKQIVEKVIPLQMKYKEIVIKQSYSQPYIFFLFFEKYNPEKYQRIFSNNYISNKFGDVGLIPQIDNLIFRDINWQDDQKMKGKLFIVDPIDLPAEKTNDNKKFKVVDEIKYPNGNIAFRFIEIL